MRHFPILFLLFVGHNTLGQYQNLFWQKKHFDSELKQWTKTFTKFRLSDFKVVDTLRFDNNYPQDFKSYKEFLSIYRPIITYSVDSSRFIDIYSYRLNLEKVGNRYKANPDIDQAVLLCDRKAKYWNRIYFGTSTEWIDEVIWISKTKFILAGIIKPDDNKKKPLILVGDTHTQTLIKYVDNDRATFQTDQGYSSRKLSRIKIYGL